jgi:hypothetical protein
MLDRSFTRTAFAVVACAVSALALIGCNRPTTEEQAGNAVRAQTQYAPANNGLMANYSVLVDLSGTWHNEGSRTRNEALLRTVGIAVKEAALRPRGAPAAIRYHVIGSRSLMRDTICFADFAPILMGQRGEVDPNKITNTEDLTTYLTGVCATAILSNDAEPYTEISATLATALASITPNGAARRILLLSDMKEDPAVAYDLSDRDFTGIDVIILYRTVEEDMRDPAQLEARIASWRARLEGLGARVYARPDTGLTVNDLAAFLSGDLPG